MIETISNPLPLAARLRDRIRREGPLPFCDWMKAALYEGNDGYYCRHDRIRWGREGDYRTSPERSSLFAATFARYFARLHTELGQPSSFTIFEAGAGNGQFAEGVLRTLKRSFPNVFEATSYVIAEVSEHACALARERLQPFADRVQFRRLEDRNIERGVIFTNELLDALPVHRVTLSDGQLREFYVTVRADGDFDWTLATPDRAVSTCFEKYFAEAGVHPVEGQIIEVSLEIENWLRTAAASLGTGYVVTVDYGAAAEDLYSPDARLQGTLRGFRDHHFVEDVLAEPGEHDLTTTLNWSFVQSCGSRLGLEILELERQDRFLIANGFLEQLEIESSQCRSEAERLRLTSAAREMILPGGMGSHFQVLVQKKTQRNGAL
jgi:SAM-dependent MidA family methyltransferase